MERDKDAERSELRFLLLADETCRVVRVSGATVARERGIRTQRPRLRHSGDGPRCQDRFRRLIMLDPVDERLEQRLRLRTASATAVPDARRHEQAGELLGVRVTAPERLRDTIVVVDASLRHDELIGEAVPH